MPAARAVRTVSTSAVAALAFAVSAVVATAEPTPLASTGTVRIAIADRYATSAQVSTKSFTTRQGAVFVASGQNFPDALAGGAAAAKRVAPLLLTTSSRLSSATASEIKLPDATAVAKRVEAGVGSLTKLVTITEDKDPNNKIGRPGGYVSAATLYDQGVTCAELGVECGATVEVWPDEESATARAKFIQDALKGANGVPRGGVPPPGRTRAAACHRRHQAVGRQEVPGRVHAAVAADPSVAVAVPPWVERARTAPDPDSGPSKSPTSGLPNPRVKGRAALSGRGGGC